MALKKTGVQLVIEGADTFFSTMSQADRAVMGFGDGAGVAAGKIDGAGQIMTGALRQVGTIAINAAMEAGRAVVGFVSDSISAAGDFESGMNKFAAVAGGALKESGLSLKDFRDQFIQIGKELPVSTAEVQQAAIEMVKGGIDPATIAAGGLKQVIQFAAAADLDLAQSAEIAAKAIGGWVDQTATAQERADFLTHSTDLLAKAANASTVDVDNLAQGLYNVQGTAKLAGVSFDETVTTLAQLAPNFASSADAGTSFKVFLSRLQPATGPAIDAMNDLGLMFFNTQKAMDYLRSEGIEPAGTDMQTLGTQVAQLGTSMGLSGQKLSDFVHQFDQSVFYDAQGNFVGMAEASKLLQGATEGLTEAQRVQYLQTIFGQDGIRVAAVLSEQGAEGYNNMTAALEKQNSVQEMAAQKQAGFNTAMDNFKGSIEALQITVGSALLPVLTDLFNNVLAPAVNTLTDLAAAVFGDQEAFARLSPTMQEVAGVIQIVIGLFQDLLGEGGGIGVLADDLREMFGVDIMPFVHGLDVAVDAFQSTGDESSQLGKMLDDLGGVWNNLQSTIAAALGAVQKVVSAVLPVIQQFIADHGEEIDAFFKKTWDTIIEIINTALELYQAIVVPALEAIASFIATNGDQISAIVGGIWEVISNIIEAALTLIAGILKATLQIIQGDWSGAWETVQSTASSVWENIKGIIDGNVKVIGGLIDTFIGYITGMPGQVSGVGEAVMNSIWDGMKRVWDEIMAWIQAKLAEFKSLLPSSEPKDPSSPLRGLPKSGMAIIGMLQQGIDRAGPLVLPPQPQIMAPAIAMPRPVVQLVQPASTSNVVNNYNTTNNMHGSRGLSFDHMAALYGSRG